MLVCSLGISQTCGGREGPKRMKRQREADKMPEVRVVKTEIKTPRHEKCALCLCLRACKLPEKAEAD